jgi:hypothetical protein
VIKAETRVPVLAPQRHLLRDDYASTGGKWRGENDTAHGTLPGDPGKAAAAIITAVESTDTQELLVILGIGTVWARGPQQRRMGPEDGPQPLRRAHRSAEGREIHVGCELRPSDGDRYLAGHLAVFQVAERVLSLSEREGPVEGRRYFAGLDERGQVLKLGGADEAKERGQPLADEG